MMLVYFHQGKKNLSAGGAKTRASEFPYSIHFPINVVQFSQIYFINTVTFAMIDLRNQ